MTDKRFGVSGYTDKLYDRDKGNQYYFEDMADWYKICELLNELNDECIELREAMKRMMMDLMSR